MMVYKNIIVEIQHCPADRIDILSLLVLLTFSVILADKNLKSCFTIISSLISQIDIFKSEVERSETKGLDEQIEW